MSLTPVEIRHVKLRRRPLGYERSRVDRLLDDIATSFEDVWRDRADLRDEIERLESELHRQREIEEALCATRCSPPSAWPTSCARGPHREADLIVEEARAKAREIAASTPRREQERMRGRDPPSARARDRRQGRVPGFLASALDRLEGEPVAARDAPEPDRQGAG